jgi:hypothetical protein
MASSLFENLPPEIRSEIYSHILLDQNVAYTTSTSNKKLRWKFEVALFRVCKSISVESLQFFRLKNAFVLIDTNMIPLLDICQRAIPTYVGPEARAFQHSILKMDLSLGIIQRSSGQVRMDIMRDLIAEDDSQIPISPTTPKHLWRASAIFAARHLPKLIHLINCDFFGLNGKVDKGVHSIMNLRFCTLSSPFYGMPKPIDLVVRGIHGIHATRFIEEPKPTSDSAEGIIGEMSDTNSLTVKIMGDLDPESRERIKATPHWKFERLSDIITLIKGLRKTSEMFRENEDYISARGEISVAYSLSGKLLESEGIEEVVRDDLLLPTLEAITLIRIDISALDSCQGYHRCAVFMAENAWLLAKRLSSPSVTRLVSGTPGGGQCQQVVMPTSALQAMVKFRLGSALADGGFYPEAVAALIEACRLESSNMDRIAKLNEVKALYDTSQC